MDQQNCCVGDNYILKIWVDGTESVSVPLFNQTKERSLADIVYLYA